MGSKEMNRRFHQGKEREKTRKSDLGWGGRKGGGGGGGVVLEKSFCLDALLLLRFPITRDRKEKEMEAVKRNGRFGESRWVEKKGVGLIHFMRCRKGNYGRQRRRRRKWRRGGGPQIFFLFFSSEEGGGNGGDAV